MPAVSEGGARRRVDVGDSKNPSIELFGIKVPPIPTSEIPIVHPDLERFPLPSEYPWKRIQDLIGIELGLLAPNLSLTTPSSKVNADFAVPTHALAKSLGEKPGDIATKLAEKLRERQIPQVARIATADSGYVNFEVNTQSLGKEVLDSIEAMGDEYGHQNLGEGRTVVLDASSPNVAKYMSVGHLRSTVIGESLARIYAAAGYTTIRDNHLGDWGTQFGMLGRAKELWGEEIDQEMPESARKTWDLWGEKIGTMLPNGSVKRLYRLYVKIHEEVELEKQADLERLKVEYPEEPEEALAKRTTSALEQEGRAWFKRLENGDPQARELLDEATVQSLEEFRRVYGLLGSSYEYYLGESFYVPMLPDVISTFVRRGIATRDEKGAAAVEFPQESHLNRLVIQKSDGSSLYSTRDLATLVARTAWFDPDKILYVVGADQKAYFREVFAAFNQLAEGEGPELDHTYFGMVSLPEGRMSTRRGRVVFLEDVLNEAINRARIKVMESNKDMPPQDVETVARQVGVGSVIYMDLGQSRERNIKFDMEQALSPEGNSAPYIQYAHARAKSLLRRAEALDIPVDHDTEPEIVLLIERDLIKQLAQFPIAIQRAIETNEPSAIAAYTYKVAELFSKFYKEAIIVGEHDPVIRNTRLRLASASAQVIKNGLSLLGIEAPEKM